MNLDEAETALADAELVACLRAALPEAKQLRDACLEAEIPVLLDRGACCEKSGCGCAPKLELYARAEDLPRVSRLLETRWRELALREGTIDDDHPALGGGPGPLVAAEATPAAPATEEAPCPACGTAAALVGGACSDCGLQLE